MEGLHMLNTGHLINDDLRRDTKLIFLNEVENSKIICVKEQKMEVNFWVFFSIQEANKTPEASRNYGEDTGEEVTQLKWCRCAMAIGCSSCYKAVDNARATV